MKDRDASRKGGRAIDEVREKLAAVDKGENHQQDPKRGECHLQPAKDTGEPLLKYAHRP